MKVLIDIPKEEYELIVFDEACGLTPLTRAVANGKVVEDPFFNFDAPIVVKAEVNAKWKDAIKDAKFEVGLLRKSFNKSGFAELRLKALGMSEAIDIVDKHIKELM